MTTRIPATEITGLYGAVVKTFSKRMFGRVPESLGVMWHNVPVLKASMGFGQKLQKWDAVRPDAEVVRAHGGRVVRRLLVVPGLQLLHGVQRRARRRPGAGDPAVAGVRGVHPARAGGAASTPRR